MKPFQRRFTTESMPDSTERFALFQLALVQLLAAGYEYIGMDHFARPNDELAQARRDGTLQRNFMGYTTQGGTDLVGIGLSSISFVDGLYAQNERKLNPYYGSIDRGELAVVRGWQMTADDHVRRDVIQDLMCIGAVDKAKIAARHGIDFDTYFAKALIALQPLAADGLLELGSTQIKVTDLGRILVRPIAMCFDAWLPAETASMERFSATV
jgi:oxygen-independent coproporphyrinogen-3 oxidase